MRKIDFFIRTKLNQQDNLLLGMILAPCIMIYALVSLVPSLYVQWMAAREYRALKCVLDKLEVSNPDLLDYL